MRKMFNSADSKSLNTRQWLDSNRGPLASEAADLANWATTIDHDERCVIIKTTFRILFLQCCEAYFGQFPNVQMITLLDQA